MKEIYQSLCLIAVIFFVTSCSGTVSSLDDGGEGKGHVYIIPEALAKRLMLSAMKSEFSAGTIETLSDSRLGYHSSVDWGGDTDKIELVAIPSQGINKAGDKVQGYVFMAKHSGTAPASGIPTVERLIAHVVKDAEKLGVSSAISK